MNCKIQSYNYVRAEIFGKKPTGVNRIIGMRSKPQSHTEFQFSERYESVSFSATTADMEKGEGCCRFKFILYSHARERWDAVDVPLMELNEDAAWAEACKMAGMPKDWLQSKLNFKQHGDYYTGYNAIKYDLKGQLCHLFKMRFWKPSKKKTWCTKAVARVVGVARQPFFYFLDLYKLNEELRPDQMDMMARYYFSREPKPLVGE